MLCNQGGKMMTRERMPDDKVSKPRKEEDGDQLKRNVPGRELASHGLASLQQSVGNRAVQRLLAQRNSSGDALELDEDTAGRIERARGSGQPLEGAIQKQMGDAMGHDLSSVRVHTSPESDALSRQLSAKAFTTGQDIFFREGAYQPGSAGGRELIAHELTHVVQQSTGAVSGSGSGMTVNPPDDVFEQEADDVARTLAGTEVQRQVEGEGEEEEEEELPVQMQALEEDEGLPQ
jgi:hypothetical protein